MHIAHALDRPPNEISPPYFWSIGTFDGVHIGHQRLLQRLQAQAKRAGARTAVATFGNHPAQWLSPKEAPPLLCSSSHKLYLLEQMGIDCVLLLEFNQQLAEQSAAQFLGTLQRLWGMTHLLLGYDAVLGQGGQGTPEVVKTLAQTHGFGLSYLERQIVLGPDGSEICPSSRQIRHLMQAGEIAQAARLLGRAISFLGPIVSGQGQGRLLGYPTANLALDQLCLPPFGVYAVWARAQQGEWQPAVANLGVAPTLRQEGCPYLEVHFLRTLESLPAELEVALVQFLRPEKRFATAADLKAQIARDVQLAREHFQSHPTPPAFSPG